MAYADQLERLIAQSEGQSIIVNQYFQWFSFDVMGQVAFSKDFNMLKGADWHSAIKVLREGMKILGPLSPAPWLMSLGSHVPTRSARDFNKMVWFPFETDSQQYLDIKDFPDTKGTLVSLMSEENVSWLSFKLQK